MPAALLYSKFRRLIQIYTHQNWFKQLYLNTENVHKVVFNVIINYYIIRIYVIIQIKKKEYFLTFYYK